MTKNERYTLELDVRVGAWLAALEWNKPNAKTIFTLDPAACDESFWGASYLTKEEDGLKSEWDGDVWLNPPFTQLYDWSKRIWQSVNEPVRNVVFYIPGDRIEQPFWHEFIEPYRDGRDGASAPFQLDVHFRKGRPKFGFHGNPLAVNVGSPPFKMVYCVFRRRDPGVLLPVPRMVDCPLLKAA